MPFFNLFSKKKDNKKSISNSNEIEGEKLFRQGIQYSQLGNQQEAIKFFARSIEVSPNHSAVYINRGACFMIQERYLESFDDFSYAIEIEKNGLSIDAEACTPAAIQNIQRIQPFIAFEQKTGDAVRAQLTSDGEEHFTKRWSEVLFDQFLGNDVRIAQQFIYEEIKELEEMGGIHQEYALNCGVDYKEFSNVPTEQDTGKAFIMFKSVLCCFSRTPEIMFQIRTKVLEQLLNLISQGTQSESERISSLISWAKINGLPERELVEGMFGDQRYEGFPSDVDSITYLKEFNRFAKGSIYDFDGSLEVNLNHKNIKGLPSEFFDLVGIHVLYLHTNSLIELPAEIGNLSNLYKLDLGNNKLKCIPRTLCNLKHLEYLNLHGNDLAKLPDEIVNLENLTQINLSDNPELVLTAKQKEWLSYFDEDDIWIDSDLLSRSNSEYINLNSLGRMHLSDAEVDIMFVVKNDDVLYVNNLADSLYEVDKDGDLKLDGRVVNFIFRDGHETIQVFVAFDDQDSYSMFTMNIGRDDRLNYVAQAIFQFIGENNIENVFSLEGRYSSQYHYAFKLYKKGDKHFMVNNSQSQAYLISGDTFKSEDVDAIKSEFWN
jgi:tetratricopeptide (TPR) repeat protein